MKAGGFICSILNMDLLPIMIKISIPLIIIILKLLETKLSPMQNCSQTSQKEIKSAMLSLNCHGLCSILSFYNRFRDQQAKIKRIYYQAREKQKLAIVFYFVSCDWVLSQQKSEARLPICSWFSSILRILDAQRTLQFMPYYLRNEDLDKDGWGNIQHLVRNYLMFHDFPEEVLSQNEQERSRWVSKLKEGLEMAEAKGNEGLIQKIWLQNAIERVEWEFQVYHLHLEREPQLTELNALSWRKINQFAKQFSEYKIPLQRYIASLGEEDRRKWLIKFQECQGILKFQWSQMSPYSNIFARYAQKINKYIKTPIEAPNTELFFQSLDPNNLKSIESFILKHVRRPFQFIEAILSLEEEDLNRWQMKFERCKQREEMFSDSVIHKFFKRTLQKIDHKKSSIAKARSRAAINKKQTMKSPVESINKQKSNRLGQSTGQKNKQETKRANNNQKSLFSFFKKKIMPKNSKKSGKKWQLDYSPEDKLEEPLLSSGQGSETDIWG